MPVAASSRLPSIVKTTLSGLLALVSAVDYYQGFQRAMINRDPKVADFETAKSAREKKIS